MKRKFSASWIGSKQARKQRKYRYNAPLHVKHRFLSARLSKELKEKYGKRSVPVRAGDEVLIMRGKFAKKTGKISSVNLTRGRIFVEKLSRKKQDGSSVNLSINPSNVLIKKLNLDDRKRLKRFRKQESKLETKVPETKGVKAKEIKEEVKNVSDKSKDK